VDVSRDSRCIELFARVARETRHRRCGWDAVKSDKFDFVD
jgi:hypothetical protein